MRPALMFRRRTSMSRPVRRRRATDPARSSLLCAGGVAALGVVLSLAVILGPPHLALHVAYRLAAVLFVAASVGLGVALASSLVGR